MSCGSTLRNVGLNPESVGKLSDLYFGISESTPYFFMRAKIKSQFKVYGRNITA